jgi:hypothetical protein
MSRWEMTEPERGVTFRGEVDEYEPGTGLPRAIRGVILPNEITVYLKYTEISRSPGPSR